MKTWGRLGISLLAIVAAVAAGTEDYFRRQNFSKYHQAMDGRQQLEMKVAHVLDVHDTLWKNFLREQERSKELTVALSKTKEQLEQVVGRLNEESQAAHTLKTRLSRVHDEMDRLQIELSQSIQSRQTSPDGLAGAVSPVQLERVVVSSAESPNLQGHIISVHPEWDFVVADLGWSAVKVGDVISITREGKLLAKARVDRVQETACAATILPDWKTAEIRAHDLARLL